MKKSSKQLLAISATIAAGAVLSIFTTNKRKRTDKYQGESWIGKCSKEKLQMVKGKLEMHKSRLEKALQKIYSRLVELET
jgi:predicted  nucleic acid-binding Zn-ribbon protein